MDAKVLISEVNDLLGIPFDEEIADTLGGWFLNQKYEVELGDVIEAEGYIFRISEIDLQHILFIEVEKN